jgi:hypothetical protein
MIRISKRICAIGHINSQNQEAKLLHPDKLLHRALLKKVVEDLS